MSTGKPSSEESSALRDPQAGDSLHGSVRPFDATAQMLANLMEQRGFRVARGTYHHGNGDILPTWVIDRPEDPAWLGVWQPWEIEPEMPEDGETQTLLSLCGEAIERWNEVAWMYCDAPNRQTLTAPNGLHIDGIRLGRPVVKKSLTTEII